jgi:hypothetical protein
MESEEALARSSLESKNIALLRRVKALEEHNQLLKRIRQLQEKHNTIADQTRLWVYTCFVQVSHSGWVKPMFTTLIGNKLDLGLSREYGLKAPINTHCRITTPN